MFTCVAGGLFIFRDGALGFQSILERVVTFFAYEVLANILSITIVCLTISVVSFGSALFGLLSGVLIVVLGCVTDGLFVFGGGDNGRGIWCKGGGCCDSVGFERGNGQGLPVVINVHPRVVHSARDVLQCGHTVNAYLDWLCLVSIWRIALLVCEIAFFFFCGSGFTTDVGFLTVVCL